MGKPHIPLPEIRAAVEACRRCPLSQGRTQTVFGVGNPRARVLFVGEAPGRNEDLQGEPFVGAAGHMLNDLLAIAGLSRDDVYIANVLKCRPPGNRAPRPEEIELCAPFLREQTRTIKPDFIVTLGKFATQFILKTEVGMRAASASSRSTIPRPRSTMAASARRWRTILRRSASFCDRRASLSLPPMVRSQVGKTGCRKCARSLLFPLMSWELRRNLLQQKRMNRSRSKNFSKKVEACLSTQSNTSTRPVG